MKLTTSRKIEICKYIIQGKNNREIAQELHVSIHTVKAYVSMILKDNHLKNRIKLAYLLGKEGFEI